MKPRAFKATQQAYVLEKYATEPITTTEEAVIQDNEYRIKLESNEILDRFLVSNKIIPVICLPVRYSPERRQFELLKEPSLTLDGLTRVTAFPPVFEKMERNPSTNVDGFVTIDGATVITETFSEVMSRIDVRTRLNELFMELSADGVGYFKPILLQGSLNETVSIDFSVKSVKFRNVITDGTKNAQYQIVGYT